MKLTKTTLLSCCLLAALIGGCGGARSAVTVRGTRGAEGPREVRAVAPEPDAFEGKMIYVVVALCDNVNQGIVPVPRTLGNGQDAGRNLYWGARYGVRTYFEKAAGWKRRFCQLNFSGQTSAARLRVENSSQKSVRSKSATSQLA